MQVRAEEFDFPQDGDSAHHWQDCCFGRRWHCLDHLPRDFRWGRTLQGFRSGQFSLSEVQFANKVSFHWDLGQFRLQWKSPKNCCSPRKVSKYRDPFEHSPLDPTEKCDWHFYCSIPSRQSNPEASDYVIIVWSGIQQESKRLLHLPKVESVAKRNMSESA